MWICVCADGEALRLRVCRYQGCFSVMFLGLSLIDPYFRLRFFSLLASVALRLLLSLFIYFFRHLHYSLFLSYNNHYSSHTNTVIHPEFDLPVDREIEVILLNAYNIHHFSICNHLHSVNNTGKWVTNRISCSALWVFRWCLLNWVINGNKLNLSWVRGDIFTKLNLKDCGCMSKMFYKI